MKYVLAVIVATVCYAISLNVIKHMLKGVPSVKITSLALLMTLAPSVVLFFTTGTYDVIMNNEFSSQGLFYISILSIVGTAFALFIFNILISNSSIVFASSVTYLIPIVAVVIGVFFKESLNAYQLIGVFIVLTGILVANVKSKKNMEVDE